mgnify:FL=1
MPGELRYSIADIGKARRVLGYAPRQRLDDALPEVVHGIATAVPLATRLTQRDT